MTTPLSQRMREAADTIEEFNTGDGRPYTRDSYWRPSELRTEAEHCAAEERESAERDALVEALATDAYEAWYNGRDKWSGASQTQREFWRHRARLLVESGWCKA